MARISYDEKKQEAIQRLKMMGVDKRMVINPFKKGKLMNFSLRYCMMQINIHI